MFIPIEQILTTVHPSVQQKVPPGLPSQAEQQEHAWDSLRYAARSYQQTTEAARSATAAPHHLDYHVE